MLLRHISRLDVHSRFREAGFYMQDFLSCHLKTVHG